MAESITDIVVRESGRFDTEIRKRNFGKSPIQQLMRQCRDTFPEGIGEVISNLTYERTAPTVANFTWSNVTVVDGAEGGACLPSAERVGIGSTTRNYRLRRMAIEGPRFCAEEMRTPFALTQQLGAIADVLAGYVDLVWDMEDRDQYFEMCKHKVATDASLTSTSTSATSYPAVEATSILTQGILDKWKLKLLRDGAGQSALGRVDGMPILTLVTSAESSYRILFDDDVNQNDLRYGNPSELLKAIGVERQYKGFFHVIDMFPRRFSYSGGVYTQIPTFVESAASKGNKSEVNPDWEDPTVATHEESKIWDPMVMKQRIPKPIVAPHPKFKFDPVNYQGIWSIKNILHEQNNPDGTIIYHRGILAAASEPIHPERGVCFIHKRCDAPLNLVTSCSA